MLLQAGLLDKVIGLGVGRAVLGVDHLLLDQQAQALRGVADRDAVGQGQQAGAIDERRKALDFEVQGVFLRPLARHHEVAQAPHRRFLPQGIVGQHALEQRAVGHQVEQFLLQLAATVLAAPDHPQVEVDA